MEARNLLRFFNEHRITAKSRRSASASGGPFDYLTVSLTCAHCGSRSETPLRDCQHLRPHCTCGQRLEIAAVQELVERVAAIEPPAALVEPQGEHPVSRSRSVVLLVEDEPASEMLTVRAIERSGVSCDIHVERDGRQALRFLQDSSKPRPDLVLMDICMPMLDGLDVLRNVRGDDGLRTVPVVMLSTTTEPGMIEAAFAAGASGYVAKGSSLSIFREDITSTLRFWLQTSLRPRPIAAERDFAEEI